MPVNFFKNNDNNNIFQFLLRRRIILIFITEILQRLETKSKDLIYKIFMDTHIKIIAENIKPKSWLYLLNILRKSVQVLLVKEIYIVNLTATHYILVKEVFILITLISILILLVNINIMSRKGGVISNLIH